jgi:arylsulfatase A-like enzyme
MFFEGVRWSNWARIGLMLGWAPVALLCGEARAADERRPNIVLILTDDQPQGCMGCMGNAYIQTPNLDRLAAKGVLFSNAFVTTAVCCSSRVSLLTGQHMRRHGIRDFDVPLSDSAFDETFPALLRAAGYRTGYLGKFAVGSAGPETSHLALPADRFDYWLGFSQDVSYRLVVAGQQQYLTTVLEGQAIGFIQSQPADRPFCLTIALKEPHGPRDFFDPDVPDAYENRHIPPPPTCTPEDFAAQPEPIRASVSGSSAAKWFSSPEAYQQDVRPFYRLVSRADLVVGRIMKALEDEGMLDETVVIFSSDHGFMLGDHGLKGKWLMYEESIRVPLIIFDPRLPPDLRGRRCSKAALNIDIAPTILALAGVAIPEAMQGRDLTPLVRGDTEVPWRTDWYYEHVFGTEIAERPIVASEGVREDDWKYIRYPGFGPPYEQLFDLRHDGRETCNLASDPAQAETLSRMRRRCDEYRQSLE